MLYDQVAWGVTGCGLPACNAPAELLYGDRGEPTCLWHAEELLDRLLAVELGDSLGVELRELLRPVDGEL